MSYPKSPPANEQDLITRCHAIEGLSLGQLAIALGVSIPASPLKRKGWAGQAIEMALGASAGGKAVPDFQHLGIELKTLPIHDTGKVAESTFVTSIPLLTVHKETWKTSQCYSKLKRILWVPIEANKEIPFIHRHIGRAILWSPGLEVETILEEDWTELSFMIGCGKLAEINGTMGKYLQVRPKAANNKSLCYGFDESGEKILTLPRGFYLRTVFTTEILNLAI